MSGFPGNYSGGGGGGSGGGGGAWTCSLCTFENDNREALRCTMCLSPRQETMNLSDLAAVSGGGDDVEAALMAIRLDEMTSDRDAVLGELTALAEAHNQVIAELASVTNDKEYAENLLDGERKKVGSEPDGQRTHNKESVVVQL